MSYILDALRRAEAERERGAVPGVHTEQFPSMPDTDEAPRRPVALIATVAVLALALAGVVGWLAFGGREAARPTAVASGAVTPGAAIVPMPAPPTTTTQAASGPPTPAPTPAASVPVAATPSAPSVPSTPRPATVVAAAARPAAPRASAEPADDRVYTEAELPDAAKRALPKLAFGGSAWSSAPSSRMVIWNGRVFHEGDTVAPGVVLKRIDRKSAQVAVKGYRVDVAF